MTNHHHLPKGIESSSEERRCMYLWCDVKTWIFLTKSDVIKRNMWLMYILQAKSFFFGWRHHSIFLARRTYLWKFHVQSKAGSWELKTCLKPKISALKNLFKLMKKLSFGKNIPWSKISKAFQAKNDSYCWFYKVFIFKNVGAKITEA